MSGAGEVLAAQGIPESAAQGLRRWPAGAERDRRRRPARPHPIQAAHRAQRTPTWNAIWKPL
jgi:hypothetical protein